MGRSLCFWLAALIPSFYFFFLRRPYLGDPLSDRGSELYLAWRLGAGDRLYLDYFYSMGGPIGPYLEALVFKLFGATWDSLVVLGFFVYLALLILIGQIVRRTIDLTTGIACMLFICFLFGFNQASVIANFNYLTPYRLNLPLALLFAVASLASFCLGKSGKNSRFFSWLAGLCAALCFLAKGEILLALAGTYSAFFVYEIILKKNVDEGAKARWTRVACGFFLAMASSLIFFSFLWKTSLATAWLAIFSPYVLLWRGAFLQLHFYKYVMGLTDPDLGIHFLFVVVGGLGLVVAPFLIISRKTANAKFQLSILVIASSAVLGLWYLWPLLGGHLILWETAAPFLCFAGAILIGVNSKFSKMLGGSSVEVWFLAFTFGFLVSLRVLFASWSVHYGFVLALPSSLLVFVAFFGTVPCQRWWRAYLVVLLLPQAVRLNQLTEQYIKQKVVEMPWADAKFHYYPSLSRPLLALDEYLRDKHSSAKNLSVLPEGLFYNFILKKPSPLPFTSLTPDQYALFGREMTLTALKNSNADIIVIYPRPMAEFGVGQFTDGYGSELYQWIRQSYVSDPSLPAALKDFKIEVFLSRGYQMGR